MNYAYIRVSTDKQTTENQKLEIEKYSAIHGIVIDRVINETVSGTVKIQNRKLGNLVKELHEGDCIIITEISRLGRSIIMILNVLQELLEKM